uniref:Odorant receptor 49b n=1 Tax=Aphidius gifuensis TaxID=684658 RepID=A0A2S0DTJ2_APHGI|nr:odorant receptor 49b [Aphidius gifuensis]
MNKSCILEPFIKCAIKNNSTPKVLRFEAWFPFDHHKTTIFPIVYFIQTLTSLQGYMMQVVIDGTTVFIVFHCCGQLTVLCKVVSNYKGVLKHDDSEETPVEIFRQSCSCTRCITNHYIYQAIFVEKVSNFFSSYNLLRIMMSTTNFCLMGYIAVQSREKNEASSFILEGSFILANMSSFFGCCWVGQQLINKNEELVYAVHEISWYKYDHKCIYPMLMLLTRTKRPLRLTCGIFFTLGHELYSQWISTACSYLSVYNAMKTSSQ